jgi:hypothetical protein
MHIFFAIFSLQKYSVSICTRKNETNPQSPYFSVPLHFSKLTLGFSVTESRLEEFKLCIYGDKSPSFEGLALAHSNLNLSAVNNC